MPQRMPLTMLFLCDCFALFKSSLTSLIAFIAPALASKKPNAAVYAAFEAALSAALDMPYKKVKKYKIWFVMLFDLSDAQEKLEVSLATHSATLDENTISPKSIKVHKVARIIVCPPASAGIKLIMA